MPTIKSGIILLLIPCLVAATGFFTTSFSKETKDKPANTDQQAAKSGERPSQLKQVHKALKSMDTKIPAETSKAAQATKDAFKKRFHTTQEGSKDRK